MRSLAGKVSIVTGAGRGIGRAIALALGRAGSRVLLTARTESELAAVKEEIARADGAAEYFPADLTVDADIDRLIEFSLKPAGAIDVLVNNAGWGKTAPIMKARIEDWDQTVRTNLRAPMILAKAVLPMMVEKRAGAIVNIASVAAKAGERNVAAYSASKFGLRGFTQSLFEEVREYGIKVAAILPGFVDTPLIPQGAKIDRSKMIKPEDVAEAVLFVLNSPPASCPVEITLRPQRSPYL